MFKQMKIIGIVLEYKGGGGSGKNVELTQAWTACIYGVD